MAASAIYYPHMQFRSRKWLRTALLYYDHITRIVPEGVSPDRIEKYQAFTPDADRLSREVRELTAAGFVRNRDPESSTVVATADEFLAFASANLADPVRRRAVLPVLRRHSEWMTIHSPKIDPGLAAILHDLGLVRNEISSQYDDGILAWEMDAATAVLYMMYLANKVSKGRPLITDNILYQKLLYTDLAPAASDLGTRRNDPFAIVAAAFEDIVPQNLEDIPLKKLLAFRDKHGAARIRFQEQVSGIAKKIEGAQDEEMLREAIASQAILISEEKDSLKNKFAQSNLACGTGLFGISVPTYILHLASGGHTIVAGAVTAIISGTIAKFSLDRRIAGQSSPYSYLIDVENSFSPRHFASDLISLNLENPDGYDDRIECCF